MAENNTVHINLKEMNVTATTSECKERSCRLAFEDVNGTLYCAELSLHQTQWLRRALKPAVELAKFG